MSDSRESDAIPTNQTGPKFIHHQETEMFLMAETCKKSRIREEDLISKLPDEILTHILSYVNTNSAAATSVLSKRWKLVWASVPNLEFDSYWSLEIDYYENYVDRVLSMNQVRVVRNVELDCHYCRVSRAASWLESLAMRKAEKYRLHLPRLFLVENVLLPVAFFNHQKRLVELKLTNAVVNFPSTVCLPCLKTVTLNEVKFVDDESMKNLLSGCPAITDLNMRSEEFVHYKKLFIRSSTLRNLKLHTDCDEIVIDAPNVSYLHVKADASYEIINLPSLVKASLFIYMDIAGSEIVQTEIVQSITKIYELLGKISHVKELILDKYTTRAMRRFFRIQPAMLLNLMHITLSITEEEEVDLWLRLLACTPDGASITFKLVGVYRSGRSHNQPLNLPHSIMSCITSIKITEEDGLELMSVITCNLECATGTKTLFFHCFRSSDIVMGDSLKKILPVSNEGKIYKAFDPSS